MLNWINSYLTESIEFQVLLPHFGCNSLNGGVVSIREYIPSKLLSSELEPVDGLYIELNLRKWKWIINCPYNPHKYILSSHLRAMLKNWNLFTSHYDNIILTRDLNSEAEDNCIQWFCETYGLKSLTKKLTHFKYPDSPFCKDLIIVNNF